MMESLINISGHLQVWNAFKDAEFWEKLYVLHSMISIMRNVFVPLRGTCI